MTKRDLKQQRLVALFFLGCLLFSKPLLNLANQPALVLGVPVLYLYLFGVWALFIALVALIAER